MSRHSNGHPTVLSAFTGAGGLDLGLEAAGFSSIACIECNPAAAATVRMNRPRWRLVDPADITAIDPHALRRNLGLRVREVTLLAAGPPCQPFSKAAQWAPNGRAGITDKRAECLPALFHLVDAFLPRALLIENVTGFVQGSTNALPFIDQALTAINRRRRVRYRLQWSIVNAADFGVPQRRERVIIVALRTGQEFRWPEPRYAEKPLTAWDAIGRLKCDEELKATGRWASLLPSIPEGWNYLWHSARGGGRNLFGYRTRYWSFLLKLARERPSWTISAQPGPATGPFHWNNRPLTVREILRLQTFPLSWRVSGSRRDRVMQLGNATPPLLAEIFGRAICEQILDKRYRRPLSLRIRRRGLMPPPSMTSAVPASHLKFERAHSAHPGEGKGPRPRSRARPDA